MPTSIREQILAAITTSVNGKYDIPAPDSERDLPVTIVQDGTDEISSDAYGSSHAVMGLTVGRGEVAVDIDQDAMRAQASEMLAQIVVAMHADETFSGLADGVEQVGGGIATESNLVFAEAVFVIRYHYVRGDPYTID